MPAPLAVHVDPVVFAHSDVAAMQSVCLITCKPADSGPPLAVQASVMAYQDVLSKFRVVSGPLQLLIGNFSKLKT